MQKQIITIEIIAKDEANKWAFVLNLKGKYTAEEAMRESQRYVYLKLVNLLLLLKQVKFTKSMFENFYLFLWQLAQIRISFVFKQDYK